MKIGLNSLKYGEALLICLQTNKVQHQCYLQKTEALDAELEIDDEDTAKENGGDAITERLNTLFKKKSTITKYQTLEAVKTFRRHTSMSVQAFLNEFDKRLYRTKSYSTSQSDDILAFRLLKLAHLSSNHEELIKATIPELKYDLMKDQLKKTFSDASRHVPTKNEEVIKAEDTFLIEDFSQMTIEEGFNAEEEYKSM